MTNSTICTAPWLAAAVFPDDSVRPCCSFSPNEKFLKESTVKIDFLNSESWENIRKNMLEGRPIEGCQKCYNSEKLGSTSNRKMFLEWFKEPKDVQLEFLDIGFSNTCNLACVHCDSQLSSKWGAEDFKHKRILIQPQKVSTNFNYAQLDLQKLSVLKIVGGEPLLEQDKCISLLEKTKLENLTFTLTTNCTIFPNDKLLTLLEKCKAVHYFLSVDGLGSVNEWYRWPTDNKTVENNIRKYYERWENFPNIILMCHTVINCYNIWTLGDFVVEMKHKFPNIVFDFDFLNNPNWQEISIIPNEYKKGLEKKLKIWRDSVTGIWAKNSNPFDDSIKYLYKKESSDEKWKAFQINSLRLAEERKLDLFDMVPDLIDKF